MEKVLIETWNDELSIITRKSENAKGLLEFELDFFTTKNQNKLKKTISKNTKRKSNCCGKAKLPLFKRERGESFGRT